jgi:hypothetical protein
MSVRSSGKKRSTPPKFSGLRAKLPAGIEVVHVPEGEVKMSVVLLEFLDPFLKGGESEAELHGCLKTGIIAWNAAQLSPAERRKFFSEALAGMPLELRLTMKGIIDRMIRIKEESFADNRKKILEYHLTMTKDGPHLSVAASMTE